MPEARRPTPWTIGQERAALGALLLLLAVLWLGFVVHRSDRFAGSLVGGVLAVTGGTLMVATSLAYFAVKRIPWLKRRLGTRLGVLLRWHVYGGVLGAVLVVLHTGHRFESDLGVALTATVLLTVFSGYVGRHLLGRVSLELREKQGELARLEQEYNELAGSLSRRPPPIPAPRSFTSLFPRLSWSIARQVGHDPALDTLGLRAVDLTGSIAEMEYSIRSHQRFKTLAALWLGAHVVGALGFYLFLGLHVWAALHFGLRWFGQVAT